MRLVKLTFRRARRAPETPAAAYVRQDSPLGDGQWIENLGGVQWWDAPAPPRLHRCWPQTRGWVNRELVERCACGSLRFDGEGPWMERGKRRVAA